MRPLNADKIRCLESDLHIGAEAPEGGVRSLNVSVRRVLSEDVEQAPPTHHLRVVIPIRPMTLTIHGGPHVSRTFRLCPYTVCLINGARDEKLTAAKGGEALLLTIDRNWFNGICKKRELDPREIVKHVETCLHPDVPPIVNSLRRHLSFRDCPPDTYLELSVELLLSRVFWNAQSPASGPDRSSVTLTDGSLHAVLVSIESGLEETIRVSDLAKETSMSSSQFTRAFKAAVGVAPRHYIMERRVLRAQRLVEETDLSLAEIALDAGFSNQAHMTAMFAREFGIPPGRYRQMLRNKP